MKTTLLFIAAFSAGLWLGSTIDKEILLVECVEQTEGTDTDCEKCYQLIYNKPSND